MPLFRKKKKDQSSGKFGGMPFFRHQSEKCHKRQQDQELISQQDPEPKYDLSACEITHVPSSVYAECKVLQKQILLLHDNWLSDLGPEEGVSDVTMLRILDLHNNELKSLPNDFGRLTCLQILDLTNNRLKHLPDSFAKLDSLQTLKLKRNRFKSLPEPVCKLKCLRTLDVTDNEMSELPADLCYARALETLVVDVDRMGFPPNEICQQGTGAIMMYLCGKAGIAYEHPAKYWLRISGEARRMSAPSSMNNLELTQIEAYMTEGVQAYQNVLDQKRKDAEELEKVFYAEQVAQGELAAQAAHEHRRFLSTITQNNDQISKDLDDLSTRRDQEREEFLKLLNDDEKGVSILLSELLDYNTKAKETEELLEVLEQERQKEDDWFTVRWEECQNVRKQEVLDAMKMMLCEFASIEEARLEVEMDKDEARKDALFLANLNESQAKSLVDYNEKEHQHLVAKLAREEELQKTAFEALMMSRDSTHSRIRAQIALIETELTKLSKVEMERREERKEHEMNLMCDQRIALSAMLSQLLEEEEKRRTDLRKRLVEMEQQREDGQTDYWLVQYQRLLDWKPQTLIDRETQLEKAVKEILEASGASEYMAMFARHRITIETLQTLTDRDLSGMGVHQLGIRRSILKNIDSMPGELKSARDKLRILLSEPSYLGKEVDQSSTTSEAVESTSDPTMVAPSAPLPPALLERQASITARGLNTECAICMEQQSGVIFLPCGHVCCCGQCSQAVKECPLCRAEIQVRIKLTVPSISTESSS